MDGSATQKWIIDHGQVYCVRQVAAIGPATCIQLDKTLRIVKASEVYETESAALRAALKQLTEQRAVFDKAWCRLAERLSQLAQPAA